MRRLLLIVGVAVAFLVAALLGWPTAGQSQAPNVPNGLASAKAPAPLPIAQVILFSSGVGYFHREGEVDGSARIDLSFQASDINDLLKSLVLQDLGGGRVSAVSYDSHEPIEKTLRSFALNLTGNPTFGALLVQARGEKVEVVLPANASQPGTFTGVIVGLEVQQQQVGKDQIINVEMLNLLTAEGLRSIALNQVQRVRFLNPTIDNELKRALEVLALSHDSQKKTVNLTFTGDGKRVVRVGYVVENPIWKTSYRLVLDQKGKPFIQGWAVVENTSDEDWSNVRMSLVSGRPISFQMDLYSPLYLPRPTVEPELFASLRPPTYGGAMAAGQPGMGGAGFGGGGMGGNNPSGQAQMGNFDNNRNRFNAPGGMNPGQNAMPMQQQAEGNNDALFNNNLGQNKLNFEEFARRQAQLANAKDAARKAGSDIAAMNIRQGVSSAASAEEMGDYFLYNIDQKVTLPRQKSAMLPIVNKDVEVTKVSIYNEMVHNKFPLLGLKFKNTTGQHLMQGPITVFEGNSYAGDARVLDMQPNEERLLSYAIDLGTEVKPEGTSKPDELTAARIVKGVVHASYKLRHTRTYKIKNRSEHDRTLIIEHPIRQGWKLISPEKPSERSRDVYRLQLTVGAGKEAVQDVIEEQTRESLMAFNNLDDQTIQVFLRSTVTSPKVKKSLEEAVQLKLKWMETQRQLADGQQQITAIRPDQDRLRANLKELPPNSELYKTTLEKMTKQEKEFDALQEEGKRLRVLVEKQRKDFEGFLVGMNVE